jgi:hypothetical protein
MSKAFEAMKKAIQNKEAEALKSAYTRIKAEKAKRYEYHKKYNAKKKEIEDEVIKKAEELGLIK